MFLYKFEINEYNSISIFWGSLVIKNRVMMVYSKWFVFFINIVCFLVEKEKVWFFLCKE